MNVIIHNIGDPVKTCTVLSEVINVFRLIFFDYNVVESWFKIGLRQTLYMHGQPCCKRQYPP